MIQCKRLHSSYSLKQNSRAFHTFFIRSSYCESTLKLPVDERVEPVGEGYEGHPSEDEEEVPVLPRGGEGSEDDFEWDAEEEDVLEWAENTGDLVVDEVVDVAAEGVHVVVFMDSMRVDLASFGLSVVIPIQIPGVAGTYSIPEDKERQSCPPKCDPDIASTQQLVTSLLECVDSCWILKWWYEWRIWAISC